eukprot:148290-Chlamydomonas_euryale.AAC.1
MEQAVARASMEQAKVADAQQHFSTTLDSRAPPERTGARTPTDARSPALRVDAPQVALSVVVQDVMDLTMAQVSPRVDLVNAVPPGLRVRADAMRLLQVLNSLLSNAAKFTHEGVIRVDAEPGVAHPPGGGMAGMGSGQGSSGGVGGGGMVTVMVRDTGIGIPASKLPALFEPFEQSDMGTSRRYGGCGLGLSLVTELVRAHGGEVWVESSEGCGSTFAFTLPSGLLEGGGDGAALPPMSDTVAAWGGHRG